MNYPTAAVNGAHAEAPTKETKCTSIGTGLGWHFSTGELGYGDGRKIATGVTHTVDVEPVMCESGLHDSMRIIDALKYAPGHVLARTRLGGAVVRGNDKRCGTERTYLEVIDASAILHEFACRCAERFIEGEGIPDPRSVAGIAAKRAWLRGEMTDEQLAAARAAARAAAIDSASAAAWAAAWAAVSAATSAAVSIAAWAVARTVNIAERENDELTRIAFESLAEVGYTEEQAAQ